MNMKFAIIVHCMKQVYSFTTDKWFHRYEMGAWIEVTVQSYSYLL